MSDAVWIVLGVAVVAVVLIGVMGKQLGWFTFTAAGAKVEARKAQDPGGATLRKVEAKGDAEAIDYTGKRASAERVKSDGAVRAVVGKPDGPKA